MSKEKPVKELLPKGELVFPVSQHIGAPAKPVVKVGDTVLRGQVIAEAGGFVSKHLRLGHTWYHLSYNPFYYNTFRKIVQYGDKKSEKNKKLQ